MTITKNIIYDFFYKVILYNSFEKVDVFQQQSLIWLKNTDTFLSNELQLIQNCLSYGSINNEDHLSRVKITLSLSKFEIY